MDKLDQLLRSRAETMAPPQAVPDDLMARILADAARLQPQPRSIAALRPAAARPVRLGFWAALNDMFGGSGVLAGLATAACAGVYLGVAQPTALDSLAMVWTGSSAVDQLDFMPSIDSVLAGE